LEKFNVGQILLSPGGWLKFIFLDILIVNIKNKFKKIKKYIILMKF